MAGRKKLNLSDKDKAYLGKLTRKRSTEARTASRAKILLHKSEGYTIDEIAQILNIHRNTVILCLRKYAEGGVDCAIYDKPRKSTGRGHGMSQEARDWIISIASKEPQYAGFLDSSWSYEGLTSYIIKNAAKAGFPELLDVSKTTVRRILDSADNASLKIRRNDMSQHRHDGEVQLSIPFDDFLSPSAKEWENAEAGEQLSMLMMFDLSSGGGSLEPDGGSLEPDDDSLEPDDDSLEPDGGSLEPDGDSDDGLDDFIDDEHPDGESLNDGNLDDGRSDGKDIPDEEPAEGESLPEGADEDAASENELTPESEDVPAEDAPEDGMEEEQPIPEDAPQTEQPVPEDAPETEPVWEPDEVVEASLDEPAEEPEE